MLALGDAPLTLSPRQRNAFAGMIYKAFASALEDDPVLTGEEWRSVADAARIDRERGGPLSIPTPEAMQQALEARFGRMADAMLDRERLPIAAESRAELLNRVAEDMEANARLLARYADGDYSPRRLCPTVSRMDAAGAGFVAERLEAGVRLGGTIAQDRVASRIGPDLRMAAVGAQYPCCCECVRRPSSP